MRLRGAALAVLLALRAAAEEPAPEIAAQVAALSAEDPSARDRAEQALLAGGDAAERAVRALTAGPGDAGDAELRTRAARILEVFDTRRRVNALPDAWGIRWFLLRRDGELTGCWRVHVKADGGDLIVSQDSWVFTLPRLHADVRLARDETLALRRMDSRLPDNREFTFDLPEDPDPAQLCDDFIGLVVRAACLRREAGATLEVALVTTVLPGGDVSYRVEPGYAMTFERSDDEGLEFEVAVAGSATVYARFTTTPGGALRSYEEPQHAFLVTACTEEEAREAIRRHEQEGEKK